LTVVQDSLRTTPIIARTGRFSALAADIFKGATSARP
jgi:hypothetical protein